MCERTTGARSKGYANGLAAAIQLNAHHVAGARPASRSTQRPRARNLPPAISRRTLSNGSFPVNTSGLSAGVNLSAEDAQRIIVSPFVSRLTCSVLGWLIGHLCQGQSGIWMMTFA